MHYQHSTVEFLNYCSPEDDIFWFLATVVVMSFWVPIALYNGNWSTRSDLPSGTICLSELSKLLGSVCIMDPNGTATRSWDQVLVLRFTTSDHFKPESVSVLDWGGYTVDQLKSIIVGIWCSMYKIVSFLNKLIWREKCVNFRERKEEKSTPFRETISRAPSLKSFLQSKLKRWVNSSFQDSTHVAERRHITLWLHHFQNGEPKEARYFWHVTASM